LSYLNSFNSGYALEFVVSLVITGKSEQPMAGEKLRFGSFNNKNI
jgi:hypothetical protein